MNSTKKRWITRLGVVIVSAALVEIISIIQYHRVIGIMQEEMDTRSHVILGLVTTKISHTLELTESSMRENLWEVRRGMAHPDSVFMSMVRLIDDNPQIVGGCIAFTPYYYPSKGRLFEPYAHKEKDGSIVVEQLAGPDHDYTLNQEYIWVVDHKEPCWTDPYRYGPDSLDFATYSYPIYDDNGKLLAICGVDIDLSWLGDSLNARHRYPSSFGMLLTQEGDYVAGPSKDRIAPSTVQLALDIVNGKIPASDHPDIMMRSSTLPRDPFWRVVQVYRPEEVFARMRQMRRNQVFLLFLGLAILFFMINRYARSETNLRQASEEQARMSGELKVASNIQQKMLPKTFPPYVYGFLEPALEVGGDLFDCFVRDGKLFFCIGDVSGKGVPAAMLMSMTHSLFRVQSHKEESPSHILQVLNKELCRGNDAGMFITFFMGCLDLYSGVLRFSNAGHDKPFLVSGEEIALLPTKANLPLGAFPTTRFEEQTLSLNPGDILFLYTDGLTEARSEDRQFYGRERVLEVLKAYRAGKDPSPEKLVDVMNKAVRRFVGNAPQSDDLTMLVVGYSPADDLLHEEITLVNQVDEVSRLGDFVKDFCQKLELDKKATAGLRLALEEAAVNVINYAYPAGETGTVTILADSNRQEIRFTLMDCGTPFDPTAVLEADTTLDAQNRPIGGLGVLLSRRLTDSVSYSRRDGMNVLTLTKSIV